MSKSGGEVPPPPPAPLLLYHCKLSGGILIKILFSYRLTVHSTDHSGRMLCIRAANDKHTSTLSAPSYVVLHIGVGSGGGATRLPPPLKKNSSWGGGGGEYRPWMQMSSNIYNTAMKFIM